MSTDEYMPSEQAVRAAYRLYMERSGIADADAEFDRFLARVRRDAAREALDGYAAQFDASAAAHGRDGLRICQINAESDAWRARRYRDRNYPEETPWPSSRPTPTEGSGRELQR